MVAARHPCRSDHLRARPSLTPVVKTGGEIVRAEAQYCIGLREAAMEF